MRFLILAAVFMFSSQANSTTVNLNDLGVVGMDFGSCYCGGGPIFGVYYGTPGDTVDFGTYTFQPVADGHTFSRLYPSNFPDAFKLMPYNYGAVGVSYDPLIIQYGEGGVGSWPYLAPPPLGETVHLIFTSHESGTIQLAFSAPGTYTPVAAIPEASTWAMMLIGFAALGVAARRRHVAFIIDPAMRTVADA